MDKKVKIRPRTDKNIENWDLRSVGPSRHPLQEITPGPECSIIMDLRRIIKKLKFVIIRPCKILFTIIVLYMNNNHRKKLKICHHAPVFCTLRLVHTNLKTKLCRLQTLDQESFPRMDINILT